MNIGKILDSDGVEVKAGCKIWFTYGIPPVLVIAPVIERDGKSRSKASEFGCI